MLSSFPDNELRQIASSGLFRKRQTIHSAQGATVRLQNKDFINFCSNDYLGLAADPRLSESLKAATDQYGVGSGSSQLVCGRSKPIRQLEEAVAEHTGRDRALIFSSGYMANMAVISSLAANKNDLIVLDKLNHASLIDAARLSRAKLKRYLHADMESLQRQLAPRAALKLVATESVFSMDGDMAPLANIASTCRDGQALLLVDDAHGFGVFGDEGKGSLAYFSLTQEDAPVLMATFGKALGGFGAFVAGPEKLIELMVQKARTLIYSTALPAAIAHTNKRALELVANDKQLSEKLFAQIKRFKQGAKQLSLPLKESASPIQPLVIGEPDRAVQVSENLLQKGILVTAIRPPTVPKGSSRLRITLSARHNDTQVDYLLECLASALKT